MENIVALCKRRGFFYPSSEIYGGLANAWDFGHYGTLLKNNLRDLWLKRFVTEREDMVLLDAGTFLNPKVWIASGHVTSFTDALVDCKNCHYRTRADHLIEDKIPGTKVEGKPVEELTELIQKHSIACPRCGKKELTDVKKFNLLFETHLGIIEESKSLAYLRGELAQGIFVNFKNVLDTMRIKVPFGIASQGKVFRNEITMGQAIFRTIEFDLMEFEYFIEELSWEKMYDYWKEQMMKFALDLGLSKNHLRWREHEEFERSHYSKKTMDVEYRYPFGWKEMWGLAYRTDYDLSNHMKNSGKSLLYRDSKTGSEFIPHVIEPTFGLSRLVITIIADAYREEEINGGKRTLLKIHPAVAPVKAAVFPLQKDPGLRTVARSIFEKLKTKMNAEFDDAGNIGKMYRRQDEIGTPFCITVDYQTLDDKTATIRDRDTTKQQRLAIDNIEKFINSKLHKSS